MKTSSSNKTPRVQASITSASRISGASVSLRITASVHVAIAVSPSSAVTITAIISPVVALAGTVYVEVAPTTVPLSVHSYLATAALAVAVSVSPTLLDSLLPVIVKERSQCLILC